MTNDETLILRVYEDTFFLLENEYKFDFEGETHTIEKGYKTDGATVPRLFWSFYPKYHANYFKAALIHDWLCSKALHAKDYKECYKKYQKADRAFKHFLKEAKVGDFTTFIFVSFVQFRHALTCLFKLKKLKG